MKNLLKLMAMLCKSNLEIHGNCPLLPAAGTPGWW